MIRSISKAGQLHKESTIHKSSGSIFKPHVSQDVASVLSKSLYEDPLARIPKSPRKQRVLPPLSKRQSKISFQITDDHGNRADALQVIGSDSDIFVNETPLPEIKENVVVDPTHVDPHLQALSVCDFQFQVFIREVLCHAFQPLATLLLIFHRTGRIFLYNRCFISLDSNSVIQWTSYGMLLFIHVTYFCNQLPQMTGYELASLDIVFLIRVCVIATKYAFTSPVEYQQMFTNFEHPNVRLGRQVISGWAQPNDKVKDTQLLLASVRQKVDLTLAWFECISKSKCQEESSQRVQCAGETMEKPNIQHNPLAAELREQYENHKITSGSCSLKQEASIKEESPKVEKHQKMIQSTAEMDKDELHTGQERVLAWSLAKSFIQQSETISFNGKLAVLFSLIHALMIIVVRLITGHSWSGGDTVLAGFATVMYVLCNFFLMFTNSLFLEIAIMDIRRREFLNRRLNGLLLDGFAMEPSAETSPDVDIKKSSYVQAPKKQKLVRFDMTKPENLLSWWYMRLVVLDYGRQYYRRINIYCGIFCSYSLVLISILLINSFFGRNVELFVLVLASFHMLAVTFEIARLILHGGKVNEIRKVHAQTMLMQRLNMDAYGISNGKSPTESPKDQLPSHFVASKGLMESLGNAMLVDNELNVITLLGFRASMDLIKGLVGLMVAGLAAGLRLFMNMDNVTWLPF